MGAAGIEVVEVRRSFGSTHAVRDMSFTASPGRVTGLIGPNGSGKTTLMLMLATLLAPDAGTIRIQGLDPLHDAAAVRAVTGWMPDVLGSWASLTTRATLELTGRLYELSKPRAAARGGADRARRPPHAGGPADAGAVARAEAAPQPRPLARPRPRGAAARRAGERPRS